MNKNKSELISHKEAVKNFRDIYVDVKSRIIKKGDLPHTSVELQLDLLDQLSEFPFGRFLLEHKGWNGYWTHYAIMHQFKGRITEKNNEGKSFSDVEDFILNRAPTILSTQQRYLHFNHCLQKRVKSNCTLASLPCGLMGDLLTLDYTDCENVKLVGIDLDTDSLKLAAQYAQELNITPKINFIHTNAWNLDIKNQYDTITSNGLNIYEPDDNKVEELYKIFYAALKPGGQLITSSITPPPTTDKKSEWLIDEKNSLLQQILFTDIIGVKWTCFRTVSHSKTMLKAAGFKNIEVIYDKAHIFPTFTADKTE